MECPGLILSGYDDRNRETAETALPFIIEGKPKLKPLITHILPFTRYAEAVDLLRQKQAIKILLDPWR